MSEEKVGNYFTKKKTVQFINTGCTVQDMVLGGGLALGRISNVVGDNSTGKTLLGIEACANFTRQYPKGKVYYHETEASFDEGYAEMLGMPVKKVIFVREECYNSDVVEGWFDFLKKEIIPLEKTSKEPILYVIDTQDALGCEGEKVRAVGDGSYNQEKNLVLNRLYRELNEDLEESKVHLMVVSQTRQAIGVTFGRKWRVTGEGALKYYASQRIQLAEVCKIPKTVRGITRSVGIKVRVNCFKNKIGLPFRTCDIPLYFGYGMDDTEASLLWLKENEGLDGLGIEEGHTFKDVQEFSKDKLESLAGMELSMSNPKSHTRSALRQLLCEHWGLVQGGRKKSFGGIREVASRLRDDSDKELERRIKERVLELWPLVETGFLPKRRKYD